MSEVNTTSDAECNPVIGCVVGIVAVVFANAGTVFVVVETALEDDVGVAVVFDVKVVNLLGHPTSPIFVVVWLASAVVVDVAAGVVVSPAIVGGFGVVFLRKF